MKETIDQFHKLYYDSYKTAGTWFNTSWLGVTTWKCPLDLWIYQEIIFARKPQLIIETGTAYGGSALYLASICDLVGGGQILTIDIDVKPDRPRHPRITYLHGSSVSNEVVNEVRRVASGKERIMVILDSDHTQQHVARELEIYSQIVTPNDYMIVEDTNINGRPVMPEFGPGPAEATTEFLKKHATHFEVDRAREKFLMTFNPGGFLRRIR